MPSNSFNASEVVGRTLTARTNVSLKRIPSDSGAIVYVVKPGQTIGVVDTFLAPKPGRSKLYWAFKDSSGRYFYAEHEIGRFDVKGLIEQGAQTTAQQTAAAAASNQTLGSKIEKGLIYVGIGIATYLVAKPFIYNAANKLIR